MSYSNMTLVPLLMIIISSTIGSTSGNSPVNYPETFKVTSGRAWVLRQGKLFNLDLVKGGSGSSMESKFEFLYGKIDMQIKLPDGNSRGTVTKFYLTSEGYQDHFEVGFIFQGTLPKGLHFVDPYILYPGYGSSRWRYLLPFDPTTNFHNYTILWNKKNIILYADGTPVLVYQNSTSSDLPYPDKWPMRIRTGITVDSKVAPNWDEAPFRVYYKDYNLEEICLWLGTSSQCKDTPKGAWFETEHDPIDLGETTSG